MVSIRERTNVAKGKRLNLTIFEKNFAPLLEVALLTFFSCKLRHKLGKNEGAIRTANY